MHKGKTKYIEAILYGRLLGALLTMPLYDCVNQQMLSSKGRGVSMQRFYILLNVNLYPFYTAKQLTWRTYRKFTSILLRMGTLALHEKRLRQTTYAQIEGYLEILLSVGKT